MAPTTTLGLFEVDPDLARYVPPDDRGRAAHVRLPVEDLAPGDVDVRALLRSAGAFAAFLVDGMLTQSMRLDGRSGLRLLGPGAVLSLAETTPALLMDDNSIRATAPSRVALLGRDFLIASRRWPWLVAGLNARHAEQARSLANQLMICQLPRVDDRLLAMMWLLAESWGKVLSAGTMLPIQLTHSVLGALIGARRPTVSLALRALTDDGSLLRQSDGWLLLKSPPSGLPAASEPPSFDPRVVEIPETDSHPLEPPVLAEATHTIGRDDTLTGARLTRDAVAYAELRSTVTRLRAEHDVRCRYLHEQLEAMAAARVAAGKRREELSEQRLARRDAGA